MYLLWCYIIVKGIHSLCMSLIYNLPCDVTGWSDRESTSWRADFTVSPSPDLYSTARTRPIATSNKSCYGKRKYVVTWIHVVNACGYSIWETEACISNRCSMYLLLTNHYPRIYFDVVRNDTFSSWCNGLPEIRRTPDSILPRLSLMRHAKGDKDR
jgi:hypothetical protein